VSDEPNAQAAYPEPLRLSDAGDAKPAWITLLTTEHYTLQTQRSATIAESSGRASIFLGSVSAGLVAIGFQGARSGQSGGTTIFELLVLTSLAFLGAVTFLRCVEIAIDDRQFELRITTLRAAYAQLVPELADILLSAAGEEQASSMLTPRRQPFQLMLSIAGSMGVITSIVTGADLAVLVYGLKGPLALAISVGAAAGVCVALASVRFQWNRWLGAMSASLSSSDA
jgi:hypothetical protein